MTRMAIVKSQHYGSRPPGQASQHCEAVRVVLRAAPRPPHAWSGLCASRMSDGWRDADSGQ